MGLADRDYNRSPQRSTRSLGARRPNWSANLIFIVVCCAVYLLDAFLSARPVDVQVGEWEVVDQAKLSEIVSSGIPTKAVKVDKRSGGVSLVYLVPAEVPDKMVRFVTPLAVTEVISVSPLRAWLQFTTAQAIIEFDPLGHMQGGEVWRFLGYGLLHVNLTHLIFNMIGLWIFGPIVEARLGPRRYLALVLTSIIAGALLFLLLNGAGIAWLKLTKQTVGGLLFTDPYTPLIGASGGVYGVILAAAWLYPKEEILFLFVIPMRLSLFAIGLVAMSVFTLLQAGQNAGGEAAHLGGAMAGWLVVRKPHLLDDFFDLFGRRRAPAQVAPGTAEIDRILDKVRDHGLGSLTERERATLRSASEARGGSGGGGGR
ncbi:MAG: rhomboid family intramembrane serine protease [Planctomycetota bacterium]